MKPFAIALALPVLLLCLGGAEAGASCDRSCLIGFASQYATALVEHAPQRVPTAPGVKFTENLVALKFGEQGLWKTVNGRRDFDIYAADPQSGNVVWIGIVKENDVAVMTTARLKIAAQRITEIETLVGRSALTAAATVAAPRPQFAQIVPAAERSSREQLIAIANSNWDAMERGDGHLAPFAVDCERYDNGEQTSRGASPAMGAPDSAGNPEDRSCFGQMNSGRFNNDNRVYPRRIWAVDRDYGLVVGLFTPNVPGNVREIKLRNGTTLVPGASELLPFTIEQVEMFRIVRGQISRVEVVLGPRVPYGMRSPFDMRTLWQEN
ncbi:MAG TPA: hypothetical protein VLW26_08265 [Steroidobacteraceae bacterium]|nr:hypothetical protein [Steroidobacteraceae bacterium]